MAYNAFITYKSEDRAWAARLYQELASPDFSVFWDRENLKAGKEWEPQLEQALASSEALIVLWSKLAAQSGSWSDQERVLFSLSELKTPRLRTRPVLYVLLDAEPQALRKDQMIRDILDLNAYPDPTKVSSDVWRRIGVQIRTGIRNEKAIVVKTVVLAATQGRLQQQGLGEGGWKEFSALVDRFRLGDGYSGRYGPTRWDWKPYGAAPIKDILTSLEQCALRDRHLEVSFEPADSEVLDCAIGEVENAARGLARGLALILVDPFSLFDYEIQRRIALLRPCFASPTNAFAVLAPLAEDDDDLNIVMQTRISAVYQSFFEPPIPFTDNVPSVGINIRNPRELFRVLALALGKRAGDSAPKLPANPALELR